MYSRILVPLDGSSRAEKILPHVEDLARKYSSEVRLLQVVEPVIEIEPADRFIPNGSEFAEAIKGAQRYLDSLATRLAENGISAKGWALSGNVVATICQVAEQENSNLIAIASHGRTGAARVFYGSVTAGLLHGVDRPILMIRSRD